jgi:hypothetical protein
MQPNPTQPASTQPASTQPAASLQRAQVADLRVQTGEPEPQPTMPTQLVQRADAAAERAIFQATQGMPAWTLPAVGGVLIFVGVALLTRGVLAKRAAKAAIDPRERAWAAVRRIAPRAALADATDASKLGEVTLRLLRSNAS